MKELRSLGLKAVDGRLLVLDQQLLPGKEVWLECRSPDDMIAIIKALKIRGAPLIGVGAAAALAVYGEGGATSAAIEAAARALKAARPTAVNLAAMVDRLLAGAADGRGILDPKLLTRGAEAIFEEDVRLCDQMAEHGVRLITAGDGILTHCNTGGLATAGIGTALGVIRRAHEQGLKIHVYADETRPLLQGGRLTAWELQKLEIPYTIICDGAAASVMRAGKIQCAFVGADRIAVNGDFANKVGTYGAAVCAHHHQVPFYPVAPYTTIDPHCASGAEIPIEERSADEIRGVHGSFGSCSWSPPGAPAFNPAFDVTPVELTAGLVTDRGYFPRSKLEQGVLREMLCGR